MWRWGQDQDQVLYESQASGLIYSLASLSFFKTIYILDRIFSTIRAVFPNLFGNFTYFLVSQTVYYLFHWIIFRKIRSFLIVEKNRIYLFLKSNYLFLGNYLWIGIWEPLFFLIMLSNAKLTAYSLRNAEWGWWDNHSKSSIWWTCLIEVISKALLRPFFNFLLLYGFP